MTYFYSRRASVQEKKNIRKSILYLVLTIVAIVVLVLYGIPFIARTASFVSNLKKSNSPIEKEDTIPPAVPQIQTPPEYTNQNPVEIKGVTEPGVTVFVTANDQKEEIVATKEGLFSYSFNLKKGENTISFTAKDSAGNQSQETKSYTITYDNEPPEITLKSPADGSSFYGSKQQQITIDGVVKDAETLKINDRIVIIEDDGSFSYPVTLQEGANNFEVTAEDKAGNKAVARLTVDFWH